MKKKKVKVRTKHKPQSRFRDFNHLEATMKKIRKEMVLQASSAIIKRNIKNQKASGSGPIEEHSDRSSASNR